MTFYGDPKSFSTEADSGLRTWLSNYEIPETAALTVSDGSEKYAGNYCHDTFDETYGSSKACRYNTSSADRKIVTHTYEYNGHPVRNYTLLFDKTRKAALWVAYAAAATGDFENNNVGRNDKWAYDPAIDESWQPYIKNAIGYSGVALDRGHQVASNDRQTTTEQNQQTFYFSNMTAQCKSLNSGQWLSLESKLQSVAKSTGAGDTLYVVTGPLYDGVLGSATDNNNVEWTAPSGYWKCAMKCSFGANGTMTSAVGCAYLFDSNTENTAPSVTTIDAIESRTGFDFFANVPDSLQEAAEKQTYSFF